MKGKTNIQHAARKIWGLMKGLKIDTQKAKDEMRSGVRFKKR